jgi:hypothetical protein
MRNLRSDKLPLICLLAFATSSAAQSQPSTPINAPRSAPEVQNPAKAAERTAVFDVEKFPIGVVSDGTNIWVANGMSSTVTKLRASDGTVLGTFPVGKFPNGVAFDGTNIWVANGESNNVMKL